MNLEGPQKPRHPGDLRAEAPPTRRHPWAAGGRILLVGCSGGIGREMASQLFKRGCRLVLFSRNIERLSPEFDEGVRKKTVELFRGDVRNPDEIKTLGESVKKNPEPLLGVVYCAGVSRPDFVEEPDIDRAIDTIKVNLEGPFRIFYEFLPVLLKNRKGFLAGITSMAGDRGMPKGHSYSASKAGLDRLLESLRIDLWDKGIKVFTIVPGYIDTPMSAQNKFPMPGMIPVGRGVSQVLKRMENGELIIRFPWYHSIPMLLMKFLPHRFYSWMMNRELPRIKVIPHPDDRFSWK